MQRSKVNFRLGLHGGLIVVCHLLSRASNVLPRLSFLLFISLVQATSPNHALATQPCVRFDVVQIADATNASTPEFLAANPDEKLINIRLPVSSLVRLGSEDSLLQYLYLISGTATSSFQIVDYAPKTTLASDVAGPISIEQNSGNSTNIGLKASGPDELPVKADASASRNVSSSNSHRLQRLPPKQLIAASGTMHRGMSAYFKLKPSSQTTLEGDKLFEVTMRVPRSWRASLLHVTCSAFARGDRKSSEMENIVCGSNRFVVGVYMAGDEVAKQSVWELAEKQKHLHALAVEHAKTIRDQRFPSLRHKLGAALSMTKPRIPDGWLDHLLLSSDFHEFERHLPRQVRMAATEYRQARKQVVGFAG